MNGATAADTLVDQPRLVALDVLGAVLGRPPEHFDKAFAMRAEQAGLGGRDRAFARLLAITVLRRRGQLDALLDRYLRYRPDALAAQNLLRLGAAQILVLDVKPHAAVATTVALARVLKRPETGLLNAVLRRLSRERPALPAVDRNLPGWLRQRWCKAYGEPLVTAIAAVQSEEPPLDLTVPEARDVWTERLGGEALGPATIRLHRAGAVTELEGYAEGAWWVQDVAATLPVASLGDVRGLRVLDAGAAPGGKTAQLAAAGARVTAVDIDPERLTLLRDNARRLRQEVETVAADVLSWRPEARFDVVVLDAPCTATGTLRRHPDIAWHRSARDIEIQAGLQARLLDAAFGLVKPGGRIVFATCSLEPEEGERLVADWLARTTAARAAAAPVDPPAALGWLPRGVGAWRSLPAAIPGGMDGFFFAHIVKDA